jgi:hypothetical protein
MNLSQAIKYSINNILQEGLTDIFPRPFEVDLLKKEGFKNEIYQSVMKSIQSATIDDNINKGKGLQELKVHPLTHVLYPKKEAFDFRKCGLIDPLDTIKYSALSLLLASEIEKKRIKKSDKKVFSYRLKVEEEGRYLFDKEFTFTAFNNQVGENLKRKNVSVLVKCDISNFYDRLNIHRLESVLLSVSTKKNEIKLINELLLFWANRDSYGLPVGSNPSRIFAEAALIDVDKFLLSHKVNFCRYVDDFRLFAPNAKTAHYWLSLLVERLSIEGLFINQSKTFIEDVADKTKFQKTEEERNKKIEEKKKEKKIISGYSGTIPTKFRNASENEVKKLKEKDSKDLVENVETTKVLQPDEFREYCKIILYQKKFDNFKKLPQLLDKFPQFTPYVCDLITKHESVLPKEIKSYLKDEFSKWLTSSDYIPEYIAIAIVGLISHSEYRNTEVLFEFFRSLRRNAGSYIGRATLEALEKIIERGQVLEIRQYYNRADMWEKRQIVKIVDKHLHTEEKNAWFKNIKMNESNDLFLIGTINK